MIVTRLHFRPLNAVPLLAVASFAMLLAPVAPAQSSNPQSKDAPMIHHAHGTFTVKMQPVDAAAEGLARYSIDKQLQGDLDGTTKGEMLSAGDPKQGNAGYVAMELVTATLAGKHGTFALQHMGTMDHSGPALTVIVAPGSGTGDFLGISGTFTIQIADGKHSYKFDYTLPE